MQPLQQTLNDTAAALRDQLTKAQKMLTQLNEQRDKLQKMLASLGDEAVDPAMADMAVQLLLSGTEAQLQLGEFQVSSGKTQLEAGKTQLEAAQEEYESAREEALKSANLNQLLNMTTLQQLIYAQNFSMPAGYIEGGDGDDNRYIVKVGDAFADADELKSMVLCNIDGIGDVRLSDVAEVEMTDNADDAYAKVDKNRAVLLSLYKSSTSSTSTVSNASSAAMETMMAENEGLHLTPIMDQGDYIKLIVNSVLSNLIEGAVLAIIVLALFLSAAYFAYGSVPLFGEHRMTAFFVFLGMTVGGIALYNAQWQTFFGDAVEPGLRNSVFTFRSRCLFFVGIVVPLLCGNVMTLMPDTEGKLIVLRIFFYIAGV